MHISSSLKERHAFIHMEHDDIHHRIHNRHPDPDSVDRCR